MFPRLPLNDTASNGVINAIPGSQIVVCKISSGVKPFKFGSLLGIEFSVSGSSLCVSVRTIQRMTSSRQMTRIAAWGIVARMEHDNVIPYKTVSEHKGESASPPFAVVKSNFPVAVFVPSCEPRPTLEVPFNFYFAPEVCDLSGCEFHWVHKRKAAWRASAQATSRRELRNSKSSHVSSQTAPRYSHISKKPQVRTSWIYRI